MERKTLEKKRGRKKAVVTKKTKRKKTVIKKKEQSIPQTGIKYPDRTGLIDGLPSGYHTEYVIQTKKNCNICSKQIKQEEIDVNEIICSRDFDFYHKMCLNNAGIMYQHERSADKYSVIKLLIPKAKEVVD